MKAGIFFTGTGPILILTSYNTLTDPNLVEKLDADPHELITQF
jgi:hypothetical protein